MSPPKTDDVLCAALIYGRRKLDRDRLPMKRFRRALCAKIMPLATLEIYTTNLTSMLLAVANEQLQRPHEILVPSPHVHVNNSPQTTSRLRRRRRRKSSHHVHDERIEELSRRLLTETE
jgi:hypothetical protein